MFRGEARPCLPKTHIAEKKSRAPKRKEPSSQQNQYSAGKLCCYMGRDGFIPWISRPTMKVATWPHGRSWDQSNPPQIRPPNSPQSAHRGLDASSRIRILLKKIAETCVDSCEFQGTLSQVGFTNPVMTSRLFRVFVGLGAQISWPSSINVTSEMALGR